MFFLSGGMFGFKLVKKMLFLQSFYIRSLLSGVNYNPPLKSHGSVITKFYCRFKRFIVFIPYIYVDKKFTVELNLGFNFPFGAFLLLLSIYVFVLCHHQVWTGVYLPMYKLTFTYMQFRSHPQNTPGCRFCIYVKFSHWVNQHIWTAYERGFTFFTE